jgi:hypothetical protein
MQQVPLTTAANQYLSLLLEQGYEDPGHIVEIALERMAQEEGVDDEEKSAEFTTWIQREVAIGIEAADRGDFSTASLDELKQQAIARVRSK